MVYKTGKLTKLENGPKQFEQFDSLLSENNSKLMRAILSRRRITRLVRLPTDTTTA